jgi:hypothetical protein
VTKTRRPVRLKDEERENQRDRAKEHCVVENNTHSVISISIPPIGTPERDLAGSRFSTLSIAGFELLRKPDEGLSHFQEECP